MELRDMQYLVFDDIRDRDVYLNHVCEKIIRMIPDNEIVHSPELNVDYLHQNRILCVEPLHIFISWGLKNRNFSVESDTMGRISDYYYGGGYREKYDWAIGIFGPLEVYKNLEVLLEIADTVIAIVPATFLERSIKGLLNLGLYHVTTVMDQLINERMNIIRVSRAIAPLSRSHREYTVEYFEIDTVPIGTGL